MPKAMHIKGEKQMLPGLNGDECNGPYDCDSTDNWIKPSHATGKDWLGNGGNRSSMKESSGATSKPPSRQRENSKMEYKPKTPSYKGSVFDGS